ncbi:MAG: SurA N-terminal domain-containing protein [Alphaproteobacteria bacterium]|nr:SurA N-terminal domain-containing protein [Alphaproteobacteria bacterium]
MTVMEKIRQSTDNTIMRAVFVIIVLVFVFFGVGSSAGMMTTQAVATVNGQRITDTDLQRVLRQQNRGAGGSLDEDELEALSKQVLENLIQQEALLQEAERVGLEVSTEEMQRYVRDIEAFQTDDGEFSVELYGRNLKRMGLTKGKFEQEIRREMMINKLRQVVAAGVTVGDKEIEDLFARTATQASLDYVRVLDSDLRDEAAVTDAAIDELLAKEADAVVAAYEADKARLYSQPRRIGIRRLMLKKGVADVSDEDVKARIDGLRTELEGGADFAELARRWSEDLAAGDGGDAGVVPENQLDPRIASAALAAGAGGLSEVVETDRAFVLVKVGEIIDAEETPLDDVKREIARRILADRTATAGASALAEALLAAWKSEGGVPVTLMQEKGLTLRTAGPFTPDDAFIPGVGLSPGLSQAVQDKAAAGLLDGVYPVEGGRIVAAISTWDEADMAQLEQLKPLLRYQLLQQKREAVLGQWQEAVVAEAKVERLMR